LAKELEPVRKAECNGEIDYYYRRGNSRPESKSDKQGADDLCQEHENEASLRADMEGIGEMSRNGVEMIALSKPCFTKSNSPNQTRRTNRAKSSMDVEPTDKRFMDAIS